MLFIGATQNGYFRTFDSTTGEVLWHIQLPAGGQATPMTYIISPDSGRQFVVIAAGGHRALTSILEDYIIAYRLSKAAGLVGSGDGARLARV